MAVSHVKSNTVGDWTGTATVGNSTGGTSTIAATDLIRPSDWNSAHNQFFTVGGNTSVGSTASGSNVVFHGGSNVTLEAGGSTVKVHGGNTLAYFDNMGVGNTATSALVDMSLHVYPLAPVNEVMPGRLQPGTMFLNMSVATISTAAPFSRSVSVGFYTRSNSTRLDLAFSASTTFGTGAGNANINNSYNGPRWLTFHSSQFNNAPLFEDGVRYWAALWTRSSSGTASYSIYGMQTAMHSATRSGFMGVGSATDTTLGVGHLNGVYSVTFSTAMPSSIAASAINKNIAAIQFVPQIILNNVGSNIV